MVSGDERCDSPGKCAKFCTYTLMETTRDTIIHCETIDKREVQNKSPNMEREAISRSLDYLKEKINIVEVTTDSSTAVTKMIGMYVFIYIYAALSNWYMSIQPPSILLYFTPWTPGTKLSC